MGSSNGEERAPACGSELLCSTLLSCFASFSLYPSLALFSFSLSLFVSSLLFSCVSCWLCNHSISIPLPFGCLLFAQMYCTVFLSFFPAFLCAITSFIHSCFVVFSCLFSLFSGLSFDVPFFVELGVLQFLSGIYRLPLCSVSPSVCCSLAILLLFPFLFLFLCSLLFLPFPFFLASSFLFSASSCSCFSSNLTGTQFIIYDSGVMQVTDSSIFPAHNRLQKGMIVYERNLLGSQPRSFQIVIPRPASSLAVHEPALWYADAIILYIAYMSVGEEMNPFPSFSFFSFLFPCSFSSLPFRSLLFSSLLFPSFPFLSLPFPSLPFPSLPFPSLPFPSLPSSSYASSSSLQLRSLSVRLSVRLLFCPLLFVALISNASDLSFFLFVFLSLVSSLSFPSSAADCAARSIETRYAAHSTDLFCLKNKPPVWSYGKD